jgi:hypothetical protein
MSYFDPVDNQIFKKVFSIDEKYIKHNTEIFNSINSYLREPINKKNINPKLIKLGEVVNDNNERFNKPSLSDNYELHNKFLNKGVDIVDKSDYNVKNKEGSGIGNDTLASFNYEGVDMQNFNKKRGGASTMYQYNPEAVKKLSKNKVKELKKEIKNNPLEIEENNEFKQQEKSMTPRVLKPPAGRLATLGLGKPKNSNLQKYINKLKEIAKDKNMTYKEAMIYYKNNK